ncbi:hypothetical protein P152DRAFT_516404 [Eremomyces bilateralis CBS 781.70]|uniref:Tautomerase cis-CaaD-like domain-containing protein n=1 Tax=Eremomyces bilateralis CBS 781.70 TaxID=1392243 RepID=A0A6G1FWD9_9PEZI|nr:uncharacterized protein P152DRAFT_516404 [Eremomyces bilateralis CBS 781.70]KAF1810001.1 hypothetical protein P152DRAFT_516404 [Eremomyces bilateralis CBS 781.70]
MPVYHIYCSQIQSGPSKSQYAKRLIKLHADTFHTDPDAVRVMFKTTLRGDVVKSYGGYGFSPAKGPFGAAIVGDHMIAHIDFRGPLEVLQEYFRKVTASYGNNPPLSSIYWQKLEAEFEFGGFISHPKTSEAASSSDAPPPHYTEQLKE